MSPSPEGVPLLSYADRVAALLAEIADLILSPKPDWSALERLEQALHAPTGLERLRVVNDTIVDSAGDSGINSKAMAEAIKTIYEDKVRDQTKPMSIAYHHTPKPQTTGSYNGSQWIYVKDYGAKYDPGSRPGKT